MSTGVYIGDRHELKGHYALLMTPSDSLPFDEVGRRRQLPAGGVLAQFTSVPSQLGNPACLQSGGPEPAADDLRFGWHEFYASEFRFIEDEE